ncbi:MAG: hypothetical protein P4L46_23590 [Fimbriimonas sp.]|nr:hypothetical protein [Fimbriimonas sp.]
MNHGNFRIIGIAAIALLASFALGQQNQNNRSNNSNSSSSSNSGGRSSGGNTSSRSGGNENGASRGSYGENNQRGGSAGGNYQRNGGSYGGSQRNGGFYNNNSQRSGGSYDRGNSSSGRSYGSSGRDNTRSNSGRYSQDNRSTRSQDNTTSRYSHSAGGSTSGRVIGGSGFGQNQGTGRGDYTQGHTSTRSGGGFTRQNGYTENPRFNGGQGSENLRHYGPSRSGTVTYSGSYNRNNGGGISHLGRNGVHIAQPPRRGPGGLTGGLFGHEGVGLVHEGWRYGYYSYWPGWRDGFFAYPFYVFDPFVEVCYCSPWYYYPCLPAYIAAPRVIIVDSWPSTNWSGSDYDWQPSQDATPAKSDLDYSIDDIVDAFQSDDKKAIDRLVPQNGNVNIYVDGKYSYSLAASDFYDTYVDGIESTKTDRYEILDVKSNPDGTARVVAKHMYNDPWGERKFVYHSYFLVREGSDYVIREFGTSNYRAE